MPFVSSVRRGPTAWPSAGAVSAIPGFFNRHGPYFKATRRPRPPLPRERGQVLLQLIEGEFRYYGTQVALRRLARTSCYFAKFVPDFPAFRSAVHQVRDLQGFRRLVKEHF